MNEYKTIDIGFGLEILKITPDGKTWTIPKDPANSDYAEYLRHTAWVEAGNNPEDFWTQDEVDY